MSCYSIRKRVQVVQTDFAGKMHFAAFFPLMEECLHDFMRSQGISVDFHQSGLAWPRVDAHCSYQAPLQYDDEFVVSLTLERIGTKSLTAEFIFAALDGQIQYAEGALTIVCCRMAEDTGELESMPIPEEIREKLAQQL